MNAIAHAAEGLYSQDGNPVMDLMAEEGIRALGAAIAGLHADPRDLQARSDALYGAWLCGTVLGSVGMALHHKLCHTLGGSFNLPHAEVHTVVLPQALAYNAEAAPQAMRRIERALGATPAPAAVFDLAKKHGAPVALKDIGMKAEDLDRAADLAASNPYWNPRPIERAAIRDLLQRAYEGARPASLADQRADRDGADHERSSDRISKRSPLEGVARTHEAARDVTSRTASRTRAARAALSWPALAQGRTIKLGFVSPQTGPLAPFGEADKWVIAGINEAFKGGIDSQAGRPLCR